MSAKTFVDTNILVYAHDLDAGPKNSIAREIVAGLWETRSGILSTQVLQEYFVAITKKVPNPLNVAQARRSVRNYCAWEVVVNDSQIILQATEIQEAHTLSFWDALIVSAAFAGNAETILTEDLNHGQRIEGILIRSPFVIEPTDQEGSPKASV
jgi:predicted nucleic acid-binding protein